MLHYAIVFLVVAIIAALFGFTGIAGTSAWIAHVLFVLFLILFIISLIFRGRPSVRSVLEQYPGEEIALLTELRMICSVRSGAR